MGKLHAVTCLTDLQKKDYCWKYTFRTNSHFLDSVSAAATNVGSLIWMITWQPSADDTSKIFILLGLWGLAEGIWQSQINSLISSVFADRYEEAFGCCRLAQGFAGIIIFIVSENFCMMTKIIITMTTCVLCLVLYMVMELLRKFCPHKNWK